MAAEKDNDGSTPMAPDINAAARAVRDSAIAALEETHQQIEAKWPGMSGDEKLEALKHISNITRQENAIAKAFVEEIFSSQAHRDIINQITKATEAMNKEAANIKDAASALSKAATVIGYAAQVAGFFASLAA